MPSSETCSQRRARRCARSSHVGPRNHPTEGGGNRDWWPNQLNLKILRKHTAVANPFGDGFDYAAAFAGLDLEALTRDVDAVMTDSQDWWPADFGHYGPFFIRMAWHSAGTYRASDGRGGAGAGMQRFAPLNSWPDNANLDKARRLLWPVKKKYGKALSWADLLIFTGNRALETMGFETFGYAGGRADVWEPDEDVYWGPESTWLGDDRYTGDRELAEPLAAVQMGLIYVNPEGPNGVPDALASARDIRETFGRMAMNDEETVALIAGGHTFGKTHGAANPGRTHRPGARGCAAGGPGPRLEQQLVRHRRGSRRHHQRHRGHLDRRRPRAGRTAYFDNLFGYEWELTEEPGRRQPVDSPRSAAAVPTRCPTPRTARSCRPPTMLTTDLALREDPIYEADLASVRWREHPDQFADAFARAWFKLTHRDMGPIERYRGSLVPSRGADLAGQGAGARRGPPSSAEDIAGLTAVGRSPPDSPSVSARLDGLGVGVHVPGQRQARRLQRRPRPTGAAESGWEVNDPDQLALGAPYVDRDPGGAFNRSGLAVSRSLTWSCWPGNVSRSRRPPGTAGVEVCGFPFTPGRTDATAEQTDVRVLRPAGADRGRVPQLPAARATELPPEYLLVDRANLLTLSAPEMTVLVGGLRVLGANTGSDSTAGVLTVASRPP